jgi:DNA-binding transcriptional regulator YiaG
VSEGKRNPEEGSMISELEAVRRRPLAAPLPAPAERKQIRTSYGVTIQAVANVLGVSRMSVTAWERGTSEPTGANATKYAQLLREMKEAIESESAQGEGTPDDQH